MTLEAIEDRCNLVNNGAAEIIYTDDGEIFVFSVNGLEVRVGINYESYTQLTAKAEKIAEEYFNSREGCGDCPFYLNCLPTPTSIVAGLNGGKRYIYPVIRSAHTIDACVIFPTDKEEE